MRHTLQELALMSREEILVAWYKLQVEIEQAKELLGYEQLLRRVAAERYFPDSKEGVNDFEFDDGSVLKATVQYRREIDKAALLNIQQHLVDAGVPIDDVIRWTPELAVGEYRKLSGEGKALLDTVITTKPGLPALAIVRPKRPKK